jgi:hypothetical protein
MQIANRSAPWKYTSGADNLVCRRYIFSERVFLFPSNLLVQVEANKKTVNPTKYSPALKV